MMPATAEATRACPASVRLDMEMLKLHSERCAYLGRLYNSLGPRGRGTVLTLWSEHARFMMQIVARLRLN